ncbi:MAG: TonB-dependent receptor [Candidatus Marinimicrobia bacterium]|nr:TonB-dependent receptor [Candidatus Neomarinimicrobiota bacterium]
MNFRKSFSAILIFATMAMGYTDTLDVVYFDQIVVTGTRTMNRIKDLPLSISVLNASVLQDKEQQPLLDLLSENVPGLFVSNRTNIGYGVGSGSGGTISMRGVGAFPNTQVLVMIDGRPDVMGLFGHPLGDAYLAGNIERIEVVRGPASVLYGSNAMGGVINIITKDIAEKEFRIKVPIKYSSFNTQNISLTHSCGIANFGYSISGGYITSEGFREQGCDDYESLNLNLVANVRFSQNLKAKMNFYSSDYEVWDPGQITSPFTDHVFNILRTGGDLSLVHSHGKMTGNLKLHHNFGHHEILDGSNYESDDFMTGLIVTETFHYAAESNLTVGFDARQSGGKAIVNGAWPDWKEHDVAEVSGLVNLHHRFLDRIIFEAGIRYTDHSVIGDQWVPAAGAIVKLPRNYNFKLRYSKGYRNPTINEMYLFLPSTEDLEAEVSETLEASVEKAIAEWFHAGITVHKTDLTNLIEKTFVAGPLYRNVGKVNIQGVEFESELLLPPFWGIHLACSFNDFSKTLTNSPESKLNLGVRFNLPEKLFARLDAQFVGGLHSLENPYNYTNTIVKTDDYFLLDFHTSYILNSYLSLNGRVDNLLDKEYEMMKGFPMPGRMFTIGLTLNN